MEAVDIVGEPVSPVIEEAYRRLGSQDPLSDKRRARETRVLRLSDFFTRRELHRVEYYTQVWRPLGIEDSLRLWLPAPPGRVRALYFERSGADYTDRERSLLSLLRPHFARIRANAFFRRQAPGVSNLTEREAEVLGWLAEGMTNAEIARILFVSPHTVRKHVENIFEKLGVHTRTAAAARLLKLAEG